MRRGIIVACLTLMVPALLLILADRSRTIAQEAARVAQRQLVEVGKTYNFWTTPRWERCKVVEAPLGKWVGIEFLGFDRPKGGWINLDMLGAIMDEE